MAEKNSLSVGHLYVFVPSFVFTAALKLSSQWMLNSCCTLTMVSVSSIADQLCKQKLEDGWLSSEVGHIWHRQKTLKSFEISADHYRQKRDSFSFVSLSSLFKYNQNYGYIFCKINFFMTFLLCFKFPCFIIISVVIVQIQ